MMLDRRRFLIGSIVTLGVGPRALAGDAPAAGAAAFVSACRVADGTYAVVLLAADGAILREIPISDRGHDIAIDPISRRGAVFGRRPGYFGVLFDLDGNAEPQVFAPEPDRHYFGHGTFSADGKLLYTSEHNIDTGDGVIGIYDVSGPVRRVGEFPSFGVGPHEAVLLTDGKTLAIANGGFATDPATGREPIDIAGMEPNMAFVDVRTGELLVKHGMTEELRALSVRHLAASATGEVWFGGQWQGGLEQSPELIGRASLDRPISIIQPAAPMGVGLKGYIGSVTMSRDGRVLAASAPRAGRVIYTDTVTAKVLCETRIPDGCGVSPAEDGEFALTSGLGVVQVEVPGKSPVFMKTFPGTEFDNHLRLIRRAV
jgi:hypothetical protein